MLDVTVGKDGDLAVSETGDISLTESVRQAVLIRLRWIYNEWRLGPDLGFPWFEDVLVKNPNTAKIKMLIRNEIKKVDEVTDAVVNKLTYNKGARTCYVKYTVYVGEATFIEEVNLGG